MHIFCIVSPKSDIFKPPADALNPLATGRSTPPTLLQQSPLSGWSGTWTKLSLKQLSGLWGLMLLAASVDVPSHTKCVRKIQPPNIPEIHHPNVGAYDHEVFGLGNQGLMKL